MRFELGISTCLILWNCCDASPNHSDDPNLSGLSISVPFNRGAGQGDGCFIPLQIGNGEEGLFNVDTGCAITVFDKSLEKTLGKRLGTRTMKYAAFGNASVGVYAAPALYLNGTKLRTGDYVVTQDLKSMGWMYQGRRAIGILGRDCLEHYCVRFDFVAKRIYFLDPNSPPHSNWGRAFALSRAGDGAATLHNAFDGTKGTDLLVDTGCTLDAALSPALFQEVENRSKKLSTNAYQWPLGPKIHEANFESVVFAGESYSNLTIDSGPFNCIGLGLLGRHQVTINFPEKTMYLQRNMAESPELWFPKRSASALGWWEMEGIAPRFTKETLAEDIVSPPNLHPLDNLAFSWWGFYTPKVEASGVSIRRPDARIRVLDLSPGNYHVKIPSTVPATNNFGPENSDPMAPMTKRGTIFVLHDYGCEKERMFTWAFLFAQSGYRTVLVDLRGHGESTGASVSYGKYEVADLMAVLDYIDGAKSRYGKAGVFGVGYGADLALNWAARDSRVGAIVAVAPYDGVERSFQDIAKTHHVTIPDNVLHESLQIVAAKLGIDWSDWSGGAAIRRTRVPVFLVAGARDTVSPANDIETLRSVASPGSKTLLIPDAAHGNIDHWIGEIAEPAKQWFAEHLEGASVHSRQKN
jgi:pimeloyl-ACP methyl ester carboxylesterase